MGLERVKRAAETILQLRDEGRLSLDDPAERYLPGLARLAYPTADSPKVTVRHLLSHASGLPEDNATADLRMPMREEELPGLELAKDLCVPGARRVLLDVRGRLLGRRLISRGSLTQCPVVPREVLRAGRNVLAIEVFPPKPGEPTVGWVDWNPAPPDRAMGLFREVRVRATGDISIENPFVITKLDLAAFKEARLTVTAELVNHADVEVSGTLEGRIDGTRFSRELTLRPRETKPIELTPETTPELVIKDPRVWWTHDLGKPELYLLALSFTTKKGPGADRATPEEPPAKGEAQEKPKDKELRRMPGMPRVLPSDARMVRFGIREVADYRTDEGYRGFKLNGRKILIRGGGWADDVLLDVKPKKLQAEVLYARHMNLNSPFPLSGWFRGSTGPTVARGRR